MIGIVDPAVLRLEFEGLGSMDLKCCEGIAAECLVFECAFGVTVFTQLLDVLGEVGLRFCAGSEEGVGAGIEAVS